MPTKIEWTPIQDYPDYLISINGNIFSKKTNQIINPIKDKRYGHLFFYPQRSKKLYIHRAVLETFIGKCPKGCECRHLDGNPQNNNLLNLVWGTRWENAQDTKKHNTKPKGENAPFHTMTNDDSRKVRLYHKYGKSSRQIAKIFNVSHTTIQKIIRRERYVI